MQNEHHLTPAELERLALLSEELSEAQQAISKIIRHGWSLTNKDRLTMELGDITLAVALMGAAGDVDRDDIQRHAEVKTPRMNEHLQFNRLG